MRKRNDRTNNDINIIIDEWAQSMQANRSEKSAGNTSPVTRSLRIANNGEKMTAVEKNENKNRHLKLENRSYSRINVMVIRTCYTTAT